MPTIPPSSAQDDPRTPEAWYPGQGLGRPAAGPGSLARIGRRLLAFVIDWYLVYGIWVLLLGWPTGLNQLLLLLGFFAYQVLLVGAFGHGLGHLLMGLQVQTLQGAPAGVGRAALRSALLLLVIPVLITDENGRGYHDRAAGTVLVRFR